MQKQHAELKKQILKQHGKPLPSKAAPEKGTKNAGRGEAQKD